MLQQNTAISRDIFLEKKLSGQPITIKKLTRGNRGVFFYNSGQGSCIEDAAGAITFKLQDIEKVPLQDLIDKRTGRFTVEGSIKWIDSKKYINKNGSPSGSPSKPLVLREGVIADANAHMLITVWGNNIDCVQEFKWYTFTDVTVKFYYGAKLSTNMETSIVEIDAPQDVDWPSIDIEAYQNREQNAVKATHTTLSNPDIDSVQIGIFPICTQQRCANKVDFQPGDKFVKCQKCSRRMRLDKCPCGFDAVIDVSKEDVSKSLSIEHKILSAFLKIDVIQKYKSNPSALEERLLMLQDIDVTYNTKNFITAIESREKLTNDESTSEECKDEQ
eukprot:gene3927-4477_t